MELRQLVTFRTVAQTLSFSRAATSLNYAQSTVSAQIQTLEDELGVSLFDRLGKSIILTDAGERLLGYAEKLLDLAGEARAVVSDGETLAGTLTISAPETLCTYRLPALLRRFRDRWPQVQLVFRPGYNADLERSIREGAMDVAFVMDEVLEAPNLVIEPLVTEPLLVLANPGHPLTRLPAVNFADLHDVPMILTERGCSYRALFERALAAAGSRLVTPMEFHSVEAIKQCVMAGIGITLLPLVAVAAEIDQGRLVPLHWAGRDLAVITQMIWHKDKWLSPALRAFLDMARQLLGQTTTELITPQSEPA
jgi:DNA-binding transcriptional LysR family regulator